MKARSREEESELNNATGQKTPPPRAASNVYFSLDDDGDVLAARPTPLAEVRPQPRVQRHTAEQIIETFVLVQVLDAPVPQMRNQVEVLRKIDTETGGTVDGSTNDRVLLFSSAAHCRADH